MTTTDYIVTKYKLNLPAQRLPIEIPNTDRESLATLFYELGFTVGAEIGVERGLYSEVLCKSNPGVELYSVDAWTAYKGYRDHVTQGKLDEIYADAKQRLAPYKCTLIKGYSLDVAKDFKDGSLDFVYIDANHEVRQVIDDISAWSRKVRPGGIIAGHDYVLRTGAGYIMHVPYAMEAWTRSYDINPWFVLGRKESLPNELRDKTRSWFYVQGEPVKLKERD
jgi:hypothetical protein